jgi:nucleoside-diphosphate-sugar epimerase
MKNVLITGAHGFIAKNTARILKETGFYVIGTSSRPESVPNFDDIFHGVLGEPLEEVFRKHSVDVIVHCAYDNRDVTNMKNAEGTLVWARQAEENNVKLQIFMSSLSADEDAVAPYGQKKYETEKWFMAHNQVVLRPGLVVGNGALFGKIKSTVQKSPFIPLIDGGKTLTYVSDIDTVCLVIRDLALEKNKVARGRIWNIQQETSFFFVDILKEISRQCNLCRIFIPVPYFMVSLVLLLAGKLKFLRLGININNLKGMRQLGKKKIKSDLPELGHPDTSLKTLIKKTIDFQKDP